MAYLGNRPATGENNAFRILDDISSHVVSFDGSSASVVSLANDTITITDDKHRYVTGQRITYGKGGGTVITGLTDATAYYVIRDSATTIQLATTASNASNGVAINLTGLGAGTAHTITLAFDGINTKFKATYENGTQDPLITRAAQLVLSLNGVIQQPVDSTTPSTGFGIDHTGTIIFSTAPASTDNFWGHVLASNTVTFDISDNTIDSFTGNGSAVNFTLSKIPPDNRNILVTLDGVVQYPSDNSTTRAYTLSENELQFVSAPGLGVDIQVRHIGFAGASGGGGGGGGVTGFYGRTGNVVLKNTDNIVANNATFSGNVSIAKTLTYMDVTNIDAVGIVTFQDDVQYNGSGAGISSAFWDKSANEFKFKDNVKLSFGDSQDLSIYHDGSYSYVKDAGTGDLVLQGTNNVWLQHGNGENALKATQDAGVEIRFNNLPKISTIGYGVTVFGTTETQQLHVTGISTFTEDVTFTGTTSGRNVFFDRSENSLEFGDYTYAKFGGSDDLTIFHSTSPEASLINNKTGELRIVGSGPIRLGKRHDATGAYAANMLVATPDGSIELHNNNSKKLETSGIGATVFGQLDIESAGSYIKSNQLKFNPSGDAHIDHGTNNKDIYFRLSKSSALDTTMMQIDSSAEITKFRKVISVGLQGGNDTAFVGGGSGVGAYLQLNHASTGINTKLMGNGNSWLNANHGYLGIGTDNPQRQLHVVGTGRPVEIGSDNATNISKFYTSTTGRSTYNGLDIIVNTTNGSSLAAYGGYLDLGTSASNGTDVTSRLRITSDGKIGIGEDDPDGNYLLIRAASTVGTTKGHIMLTGDSATVGQGPQIVFSESGSGSSYAGAYVGHIREGSNSTGSLVFGTRETGGDANTVPIERLRITSNGRVNIGTGELDQTDRLLNVYGGRQRITYPGNGNSFEIMNSASTGNSYGMLLQGGTNSSDYNIHCRTTGGTALMELQGDGVLIVGNSSSPTSDGDKIQAVSTSGGQGICLHNYAASAYGNQIAFMKSRHGTIGSNTILNTGDRIGELNFYGNDGSGRSLGAQISVRVDASPGNDNTPSAIYFMTGTNQSMNTRLSVKSNGCVGVSKNGWSTSDNSFALTVHTGATTDSGNPVNDGIMIVSQNSSGNQNSTTGKLMFCGHAQVNGPFLYADNTQAYGKKDLVFHTRSVSNDYTTQVAETLRLTKWGFFGLGTDTNVDSLMHIQGTSDNGDTYCQLTIEDTDDTAGSMVPQIVFKGNGNQIKKIRATDTNGIRFFDANNNERFRTVNDAEGGATLINADSRGWATIRHNDGQGLRTHIRMHYAPGNSVTTRDILRIRRHNWGWGTYKIRLKALYYYGSQETTYYVNGNGAGGNDNYSIVKETAHNNDWSGATVTKSAASTSSPGNSSTSFIDVRVNIPNYMYMIVYVEAYTSQYSTDPTNVGTDSYCLL